MTAQDWLNAHPKIHAAVDGAILTAFAVVGLAMIVCFSGAGT